MLPRAPAARPFASEVASLGWISREAFAVVWYMELRSSREAEIGPEADDDAAGCFCAPLAAGCKLEGRVPECNDWKPRGVSRITRK